MAKIIYIGQPANESERQAIHFLRDHLPDSWLIFHNFEMRQGEEVFEIDIAILAPHAVYLVDVKGTRGNIEVYRSKWYPRDGSRSSHRLPSCAVTPRPWPRLSGRATQV